jgi:hypothetical protein
LGRNRLTEAETADLPAPAPPSFSPWVKPLSAATAACDERYHAIARFG